MPYFYKNESDRIIIELPKFQTNLNLQEILNEVSRHRSKEIEFMKKVVGLTCLPIALNTFLAFDAKLIGDRKFLEKLIKDSIIISFIFAKIAELININKNNSLLIEPILLKGLGENPENYIKKGKPLNYTLFRNFLLPFLQECLVIMKDDPLFWNIDSNSITLYINALNKTLAGTDKDGKLSLNVWLEHLLMVTPFLTFNKIIFDYQSKLTMDEVKKLHNLSELPGGICEQHIVNMLLTISVFQKALIEKFGFHQAPQIWESIKSTGVDGLINFIRDHGCVVVGGFFGQAFYKQNPNPKFRKENGVSYYYWPKNSFSVDLTKLSMSHAVIVVGACKKSASNSQDMVFIIDPSTDMEGAYKMLAISYKSFCEKIIFESSPLKMHPLSHNGFLFHPEMKPTKKTSTWNYSADNGFWKSIDCGTITKIAMAAAGMAIVLGGSTLTRNTM